MAVLNIDYIMNTSEFKIFLYYLYILLSYHNEKKTPSVRELNNLLIKITGKIDKRYDNVLVLLQAVKDRIISYVNTNNLNNDEITFKIGDIIPDVSNTYGNSIMKVFVYTVNNRINLKFDINNVTKFVDIDIDIENS